MGSMDGDYKDRGASSGARLLSYEIQSIEQNQVRYIPVPRSRLKSSMKLETP